MYQTELALPCRQLMLGETRAVQGETYTLKEKLNDGGNAQIWRVVDARGDR